MQIIIENIIVFGIIFLITVLTINSYIRDSKISELKRAQNNQNTSEKSPNRSGTSSTPKHNIAKPQDEPDRPTKFKENDIAVLKIVAEIQHSNSGQISNSYEDDNCNEIEEIFTVSVIYTSRIEFIQEFDLSSGRQLARLIKNLEQISQHNDCEMIDHIYQCAINLDDTVYPHYGSEDILNWDGLLCFYNLQEIEYTVLTGDQAGRVIRDDDEDWYFEAAIEGYNIGFEGVAMADQFESIRTHWSNRKNSIAIKTVGGKDAKRTTKRFGFKKAKQALEYLDQYPEDVAAI
jgi:hypothetical protein